MKINPYSWLRGVKKKMNFVFHLIGVYIVSIVSIVYIVSDK